MPTYVYECNSCLKSFEADQRITEEPLTDCSCGVKGGLKRVIQPTAIMFKGSGFHINDYKGSGSDSSSPAACTTDKSSCTACND